MSQNVCMCVRAKIMWEGLPNPVSGVMGGGEGGGELFR